jgi:hypothetical protein
MVNILELDEVEYVSLVDEPAVPDAEILVAKSDSDDVPATDTDTDTDTTMDATDKQIKTIYRKTATDIDGHSPTPTEFADAVIEHGERRRAEQALTKASSAPYPKKGLLDDLDEISSHYANHNPLALRVQRDRGELSKFDLARINRVERTRRNEQARRKGHEPLYKHESDDTPGGGIEQPTMDDVVADEHQRQHDEREDVQRVRLVEDESGGSSVAKRDRTDESDDADAGPTEWDVIKAAYDPERSRERLSDSTLWHLGHHG